MDIAYTQPSVQDLFKVTYQYTIPPYQRPYAWQANQVDDFWSDIVGMGDDQHFLGPMVLHDPGGDTREVIDGQQRLTTLQMLLALIRDKYIEMGDPVRDAESGSDRCSKAPESLIRDSGYATHYFLRSGDHNRPILEDFILRRSDDAKRRAFSVKKDVESIKKVQWARNKPLVDAYQRLGAHLATHLEMSKDGEAALRKLEEALVRRATVVVLDLKSLDDAFLLFETLNVRGLRLSAADLLKSHLLSRLDKKHKGDQGKLDEASDTWDEIVDGLGGGDISGFLRHYLLIRHERVKKSDVFPLFKKDVEKLGPDKTLRELSEMGARYAEFLRPPTDELDLYEVLTNLKGTSVDTHRIALMPARAHLEKARFVQFARVAEVLSFRWTVVGGNAQDLESIYQEAASTIHSSDGQQIDDAEQFLKSKAPTDAAFHEAFIKESLGYAYVAAYALRKIETSVWPNELTIKPTQWVHVEHIMPKTPTDYWRQQLQDGEVYEEVVQRWGNLTLLLNRLNESIGNDVWDVKRYGRAPEGKKAALPGYSGSDIRLTTNLISLTSWTSKHIEARAQWLATVATRVWSFEPKLEELPTLHEVLAESGLID